MPRSRRLVNKKVVDMFYCRRCMKTKKDSEFYSALDTTLDKNGKMSVCSDCCNEICNLFLRSEYGSVEVSLMKTCKTLNIAYFPEVVDAVKTQIANKTEKEGEFESNSLFGIYKARLGNYYKFNKDASTLFEYYDAVRNEKSEETLEKISDSDGNDYSEYLKVFWGKNFDWDDYQFLENELAGWKKDYSCKNNGELFLLRQLCYLQLDIRKAQEGGRDTKNLLKAIQEVMKTAAIDPAKANSLNETKNAESFGVWIKNIEQTEPAEYWQDNKLFEDVDEIKQYFNDYIVRPLKNFITGSRDFIVTETDIEEDSEADLDFAINSGADDE